MDLNQFIALKDRVKSHFGEDYTIVSCIIKNDYQSHWKMVEKKNSPQKRIDNLRFKNQKTDKIEKMTIDETKRVIGIRSNGKIYMASDYPEGTVALKNDMTGKIMLISRSFKFVNIKGDSIIDHKNKEGIIRNV